MAPTYKLTYFSTTGRAEPIRFLFSYGGLEFEDVRVTTDEWPALKEKTPYGHLPVLEHDGKQVAESVAIARYVAKQVNLAGKDDWENLEIDSVVDTIRDLATKFAALRREQDPEKLEALKKNLQSEVLPFYFGRFDALVRKNNGYLALGRLTWVDLYFVCLVEGLEIRTGTDALKSYPNLAALRKTVLQIPNIKKWVETRPKIN